ncbi:MAG: response regulator [Planctomycetaceae bacterium]|nr:response regulator [Planctomycetaceae bacterium]
MLRKKSISMVAQRDVQLLIADDDQGFRETVVGLLEPHFQTIAVESGERAIEVVESIPIDIALLDMHMHLLTGLDTMRILRDLLGPLPCILMSSAVTAELEDAAEDLHIFSVLRKPPTRQLLLDTIHGALQL